MGAFANPPQCSKKTSTTLEARYTLFCFVLFVFLCVYTFHVYSLITIHYSYLPLLFSVLYIERKQKFYISSSQPYCALLFDYYASTFKIVHPGDGYPARIA